MPCRVDVQHFISLPEAYWQNSAAYETGVTWAFWGMPIIAHTAAHQSFRVFKGSPIYKCIAVIELWGDQGMSNWKTSQSKKEHHARCSHIKGWLQLPPAIWAASESERIPRLCTILECANAMPFKSIDRKSLGPESPNIHSHSDFIRLSQFFLIQDELLPGWVRTSTASFSWWRLINIMYHLHINTKSQPAEDLIQMWTLIWSYSLQVFLQQHYRHQFWCFISQSISVWYFLGLACSKRHRLGRGGTTVQGPVICPLQTTIKALVEPSIRISRSIPSSYWTPTVLQHL